MDFSSASIKPKIGSNKTIPPMPEKVTPTMIVEIDIIINKLFRFSKCLDLREAFLLLYGFYGSVHSCPFFYL